MSYYHTSPPFPAFSKVERFNVLHTSSLRLPVVEFEITGHSLVHFLEDISSVWPVICLIEGKSKHVLLQITVLVRSLVEHRPEWVDPLARCVMEKSCHEREPIRLTAVVVCSALVKKWVSCFLCRLLLAHKWGRQCYCLPPFKLYACFRAPDSNGDFNEKLLIDSVRLLENSLTDQSLRIRRVWELVLHHLLKDLGIQSKLLPARNFICFSLRFVKVFAV